MDDTTPSNKPDLSTSERLNRLGRVEVKRRDDGRRHSRFIRFMRVVLPVVALILTAAVFFWTERDSSVIIPMTPEELAAKDSALEEESYSDPLAPPPEEPQDLTEKSALMEPPPMPLIEKSAPPPIKDISQRAIDEIKLPAALQQEAPEVGKNELTNPRFESLDARGQPFTVTAQKAIQGQDNNGVLELEKPVADMALKSGAWLAITAEQGAYNEELQALKLIGDVRLFHDMGYELTTAQLDVDLDSAAAISQSETYIQGPAGTILAQGLQGSQETGILSFPGPAKLVLYDTGNMNLGALR